MPIVWPSARTSRLLLAALLWAASAKAQGAPGHDSCGDATSISPLPYTDTAMTTGATTDPQDPIPSCGNHSRARSVWYRFTAPGTAVTVTANTFGSDYDTILSVYEGPCESLSAVPGGCNDDDLRDGAQSAVSFQARAGASYSFMVSAYDGDGGNLFFDARSHLSPVCVGDCDDDGTVTVSECDFCRRIHDGESLGLCPPCDGDGDGQVADSEVNQCRLAVLGCIRCGGDCDGSGRVTASDLVATVSIIARCPCSGNLGGLAAGCAGLPTVVTACPSADRDRDGCIAAPELELLIANVFRCGS
jgi:hypothetical protein